MLVSLNDENFLSKMTWLTMTQTNAQHLGIKYTQRNVLSSLSLSSSSSSNVRIDSGCGATSNAAYRTESTLSIEYFSTVANTQRDITRAIAVLNHKQFRNGNKNQCSIEPDCVSIICLHRIELNRIKRLVLCLLNANLCGLTACIPLHRFHFVSFRNDFLCANIEHLRRWHSYIVCLS